MRVLSPETLLNSVHISQTRQARLQVQLTGLSQVRLGPVVIDREQRRTTLDGGLDHAGRGDLEDFLVGEGFSELSENGSSDFEDGGGGFSSKGEVTGVGDEVGRGFLYDYEGKERGGGGR